MGAFWSLGSAFLLASALQLKLTTFLYLHGASLSPSADRVSLSISSVAVTPGLAARLARDPLFYHIGIPRRTPGPGTHTIVVYDYGTYRVSTTAIVVEPIFVTYCTRKPDPTIHKYSTHSIGTTGALQQISLQIYTSWRDGRPITNNQEPDTSIYKKHMESKSRTSLLGSRPDVTTLLHAMIHSWNAMPISTCWITGWLTGSRHERARVDPP